LVTIRMSANRPDDIVGNSAALKRVLDSAAIVADTDCTVLITGETGTGKEPIARMIHSMSGRKDRNFIKLNCAAIPAGLLESELFGHEKGAFTGAVSQKLGRLELADKGTLLLDEIGEIPLEVQPKFLRFLQEGEVQRLGSSDPLRIDARVIAATNADLRKLVEDGQLIIPEGHYFVMGDNRDDSEDSRYWGFVPRENIIGRPLVIYWSVRDWDNNPSPSVLGRLDHLIYAITHFFQITRWNRTLRLVH